MASEEERREKAECEGILEKDQAFVQLREEMAKEVERKRQTLRAMKLDMAKRRLIHAMTMEVTATSQVMAMVEA